MATRHGRSLSGRASSGRAIRRATAEQRAGRRSQDAMVLLGMLLLCAIAPGAALAEGSGSPAATRAVAVQEASGNGDATVAASPDGPAVLCPDPVGVGGDCRPSVAPLSAVGLFVLVFGLVGTALVAIRPLEPRRG